MEIRVGTSGYSFPDWQGPVYPPRLRREAWLGFYEQKLGFRALEVNYTYYRSPSARTSAQMARRTSEGFCFTIKLHREQTHELRLDGVAAFREGLRPLVEAGKTGALLGQFPTSFGYAPRHLDHLAKLREAFAPLPLVVEFRRGDWDREEVYDFLQREGLAFCCADEPKLKPLMPFVVRATCAIGYLRLHGRSKAWFGSSAAQRYNYLYSREELQTFAAAARTLSAQTSTTYVFFNNCQMGAAAQNALQLKQMLGLGQAFVPTPLFPNMRFPLGNA